MPTAFHLHAAFPRQLTSPATLPSHQRPRPLTRWCHVPMGSTTPRRPPPCRLPSPHPCPRRPNSDGASWRAPCRLPGTLTPTFYFYQRQSRRHCPGNDHIFSQRNSLCLLTGEFKICHSTDFLFWRLYYCNVVRSSGFVGGILWPRAGRHTLVTSIYCREFKQLHVS